MAEVVYSCKVPQDRGPLPWYSSLKEYPALWPIALTGKLKFNNTLFGRVHIHTFPIQSVRIFLTDKQHILMISSILDESSLRVGRYHA